MKKQTNTVSLGYKKMPKKMVASLLGWVILCMKGNTSFPKPPVPLEAAVPPDPTAPVDMTTRLNALVVASAASEGGGSLATLAENEAFDFAIEGTDLLAFYVQSIGRFNLPVLLSSGFQAASTNRAQVKLDAPSITSITNDSPTELDVHLSPVTNAVGYEVQVCTGTGAWTSVQFSTQARSITVTGLTTGTVYQVRARALGGSTGQSDWSMPGSKIVD